MALIYLPFLSQRYSPKGDNDTLTRASIKMAKLLEREFSIHQDDFAKTENIFSHDISSMKLKIIRLLSIKPLLMIFEVLGYTTTVLLLHYTSFKIRSTNFLEHTSSTRSTIYAEYFLWHYIKHNENSNGPESITSRLFKSWITFLLKFPIRSFSVLRNIQMFEAHYCNGAQTKIVLLPEENPLLGHGYLIKKLKADGKKVVVVPFSIGVNQEFRSHFGEKSFLEKLVVRYFAKRFLEICGAKIEDNSLIAQYPPLVLIAALSSGSRLDFLELGFLGVSDEYWFSFEKDYQTFLHLNHDKDAIKLVEPLEATLAYMADVSGRETQGKAQIFGIFLPPNQGRKRLSMVDGSVESYHDLLNMILSEVHNLIPTSFALCIYAHPRGNLEFFSEGFCNFQNRKILLSSNLEDQPLILLCGAVVFGSALGSLFRYLNIPAVDWDIYKYKYDLSSGSEDSILYAHNRQTLKYQIDKILNKISEESICVRTTRRNTLIESVKASQR